MVFNPSRTFGNLEFPSMCVGLIFRIRPGSTDFFPIMIIFTIFYSFIDFVFGYGFFGKKRKIKTYLIASGHDMIAQLSWGQLNEETKYWICSEYDVCALEDFKTLSALPDLLKHEKKFIKYFDLHFYNNLEDNPPGYCSINVSDALRQKQPNLLKAVKRLLIKFINGSNLSFIEFSYFIHLLADLHQPFHCKHKP